MPTSTAARHCRENLEVGRFIACSSSWRSRRVTRISHRLVFATSPQILARAVDGSLRGARMAGAIPRRAVVELSGILPVLKCDSMPAIPSDPSETASPGGRGRGQIGMAAAVSIGIGGMVGAGIFSILGVVAEVAGNAMWLSFAIGGVVALLSTYSYAKLGATFPSAGGAVHFLVKSFGDGVLAGGLNLFMWAGYIISLALYATAFGSYAATFFTDDAFAAAGQIAGHRLGAVADAGQRLRREADGALARR